MNHFQALIDAGYNQIEADKLLSRHSNPDRLVAERVPTSDDAETVEKQIEELEEIY